MESPMVFQITKIKKLILKIRKKIKVKQKSDIIDNKGMHRILYTIYNLYNKNLSN